jgi:hypothetical protein
LLRGYSRPKRSHSASCVRCNGQQMSRFKYQPALTNAMCFADHLSVQTLGESRHFAGGPLARDGAPLQPSDRRDGRAVPPWQTTSLH